MADLPNQPVPWLAPGAETERLLRAGLKVSGGGAHQSKTMMLSELGTYLQAASEDGATASELIVEHNVLGKQTQSARKIALTRLNGLYAVASPVPITAVMASLWWLDADGRPLLALLTALARDPLLRDSAAAVQPAPQGTPIRWPNIAAAFEAQYPERLSPKMLKSLSQNCASTWTQSGHLRGTVNKLRSVARPTPAVAAFAALIATVCGYGGPALLHSPWLDVLDVAPGERLSLLRQAEAQGFVRVRTAGDMLEIMVRQPLAQTLRMPDLAEL